jgi:hypothetical protein
MTSTESNGALIIEQWIHSNVQNNGYDRFDDLHIDNIDRQWKASNFWIQGGFKAFQIAVRIRNEQMQNVTIALAFALIAGKEPRGLNFASLKEMERELNSSPPSLYLFRKGHEPWTDVGLRSGRLAPDTVVLRNIDCHSFGCPPEAISCQCMEFKQVDFDEYSRTFLISG